MSDYTALERRLIAEVDRMTRHLAAVTAERNEMENTIRIQHELMKTAELRGMQKASEELASIKAYRDRLLQKLDQIMQIAKTTINTQKGKDHE